jgi:two-component system nitrate/nitrite response regulator NarP
MRVLIADDHPIMLSGLEAILRGSDYQVVAKVSDGAAVLDELPKSRPELLVIDVQMPVRTGMDVLRTLRSRGDRRPVVLLTAQLDNADLVEAIKLGVDGILLKDGAQSLLLTCLDSVRGGTRWVDKGLLERALDLTMSGGAERNDPFADLTAKERAVAGWWRKGCATRISLPNLVSPRER